jgi:tetratricopeptide (TPR) repeat protein
METDWDEIRSSAERAVRQGQFDEASQLWLQALALCADLSKYDAHRIVALEGLANVYWRTNNYADALPILLKTFSLREDQLGPDHADIGLLANNLARVYHTLEKFPEAEEFYRRALRIRRKVLGVENPEVEELIKNYANLLVAAGRAFEAEDLKASTVSVKTGVWNRSGHFKSIQIERPDALFAKPAIQAPVEASEPSDSESRSISDDEISAETAGLSNWLSSRKVPTEAPVESKEWHELVARGMEEVQQNNTLQAEHLLRKAVAATDSFDSTDPRIASTLELLSEVLWKNGKLTEARPICELTLRFYESTLDEKHQDIGVISNNLAMLYHALDMPEEAEPLYKRAMAIRTANQGATHPDVITLINNYANMLYVSHREKEAINLRNYARSVTSGKWNQVGQFKAMEPVVKQQDEQFTTFSKLKPDMQKVEWVAAVTNGHADIVAKHSNQASQDNKQNPTEEQKDPNSFQSTVGTNSLHEAEPFVDDPRAVLDRLVDIFNRKKGEQV